MIPRSTARRGRRKDIKVGFLPQEPRLDDDTDVRGNVEMGVGRSWRS